MGAGGGGGEGLGGGIEIEGTPIRGAAGRKLGVVGPGEKLTGGGATVGATTGRGGVGAEAVGFVTAAGGGGFGPVARSALKPARRF